ADCVVSEGATVQLAMRELVAHFDKGGDLAIEELAKQFRDALFHIDEKENIDVAICALPKEILGSPEQAQDASSQAPHMNFRALLKAMTLRCGFPIQIVQPTTYGAGGKKSIVAAKRGSH